MGIDERYLREAVIHLFLVDKACYDVFSAVFGAEELEDRQHGGGTPCADAVPLEQASLCVLRGVGVFKVLKRGAGGVHAHNVANDAALGEQKQTIVGGRVGGLDAVHEHNPFLGGKRVKLLPLSCLQSQGRFAQHMFATFDCLFYLVIMMLGGRDYVERV